MRSTFTITVGLAMALGVVLAPNNASAQGGILARIHHHQNCPTESQTVRIPGREIHIVTARPRVIVSDASPRVRGYFPAGVVGYGHGPFVATFVPMHTGTAFGFGAVQPSAGSNALRALHEMEIQAGEVAKLRAAHKAEMEHLEAVHKRVQAGVTASFGGGSSSSDAAQIKSVLDDLSKRVSDIERLLIIHDNILKEGKK
ncbi:MAG: hypothetical protein HYR84_09645 [Planctomycetes bacterium]|nr:hypothetical protein [Planctomycetota bacterium]